MRCPHCQYDNIATTSDRPLEGGRGYALTCCACGRVIAVRARSADDPALLPDGFSPAQIAHLRFIRWLLQEDRVAQIADENPPGGIESRESVA